MKYQSLHIGNVANIGYSMCKILNKHTVSARLIFHDEYHLMSQPEWNDYALDPHDYEHEFFLKINKKKHPYAKLPSWVVRHNIYNKRILLINLVTKLPPSLYNVIRTIYRAIRSTYRKAHILFTFSKTTLNHPDIAVKEYKYSLDYSPQIKWLLSYVKGSEIIFAYAASPIYCYLAKKHPYVAVEIGTLRDIPAEKSELGKLIAESYKNADFVIVTNPDTRNIIDKLGIKNYKFVPHPIDENVYKEINDEHTNELRKELRKQGGDIVALCPARQNWDLKGNNEYFEAVSLLKKNGILVRLVIPLWGTDVEKTQKLVKDLQIENHIIWLPPLSEPLLIRYMSAVDVVIDQLRLGVFGFITAKSLACGKPTITFYNHDLNSWCFPEPPPLLSAFNAKEVADQLSYILNNNTKKISYESRSRFLKYHSSRQIVNKLEEICNIINPLKNN